MVENTVIGNVSRTHHPCGQCHALVEGCIHYRPWSRFDSRAEIREARREELARLVAEQTAQLNSPMRTVRKSSERLGDDSALAQGLAPS